MIHGIFNTCEVRGTGRIDRYKRHIEALLAQQVRGGHRVVVSGCCMTPVTRAVLADKFGGRVSFLWIKEIVPLTVSFNLACRTAEREWGTPEGVFYVDSGCDLSAHPGYIERLRERGLRKGYAMTSGYTDTDDGWQWNGVTGDKSSLEVLPLKIGQAVNLHVQLFDQAIADAYGGFIPDIFAADTAESTFSFLCAAIGKRYGVLPQPEVHHEHSMDGASSGFRRGGSLWKLTPEEFTARLKEGAGAGFGYEACQGVLMHDPAKFDAHGNALDDRLRPWIARAMFHSPATYDYGKINAEWVPLREAVLV